MKKTVYNNITTTTKLLSASYGKSHKLYIDNRYKMLNSIIALGYNSAAIASYNGYSLSRKQDRFTKYYQRRLQKYV
jgi:hypothetical protein